MIYLDSGTGQTLICALELWQGLQGLLALTIEGEITPERESEISSALREDLVRTGGAKDFAELEATVKSTAGAVYGIFQALIEKPAAALPPPEAEPKKEDEE